MLRAIAESAKRTKISLDNLQCVAKWDVESRRCGMHGRATEWVDKYSSFTIHSNGEEEKNECESYIVRKREIRGKVRVFSSGSGQNFIQFLNVSSILRYITHFVDGKKAECCY